jgi:hypothetical protein
MNTELIIIVTLKIVKKVHVTLASLIYTAPIISGKYEIQIFNDYGGLVALVCGQSPHKENNKVSGVWGEILLFPV